MKQTNKKNYQNGTSTVEFAIVAAVLFIMIFGVIEIGRGYFVYSMLDEVARRASRLAVVCPVNDPAIPQMAVLNASGDGADSTLVKDLSPARESLIINMPWLCPLLPALPASPCQLFNQYCLARASVSRAANRLCRVSPWSYLDEKN